MMNQIKHALFFVIGGIFASSILLGIYDNIGFFYFTGLISICILAVIITFFINNWDK